ncbi:neuritin-like [Amia ocellicauda]|uniref:neuritin-like n=1 Tax=Amia ocellicauda TaxID=2972642 RepID=UPI003463C387
MVGSEVTKKSGVTAGSGCHGVYRGFSACLLQLGTSMSHYTGAELHQTDIDNVCAHWEEFQACGMSVVSECRVEVRSVWDTLRSQSERLRFQSNLYSICRNHHLANQHRHAAATSHAPDDHLCFCPAHSLPLLLGVALALSSGW